MTKRLFVTVINFTGTHIDSLAKVAFDGCLADIGNAGNLDVYNSRSGASVCGFAPTFWKSYEYKEVGDEDGKV